MFRTYFRPIVILKVIIYLVNNNNKIRRNCRDRGNNKGLIIFRCIITKQTTIIIIMVKGVSGSEQSNGVIFV